MAQADTLNLSAQDKSDLAAIRSRLPSGDPRRAKIDTLLGPEVSVEAAPKKWSLPDLEGRAMTMRDWLINKLPTIGGTLGAILGAGAGLEAGPVAFGTGTAGAAAGGGLGEDARQALTEYFHPEDKRMDAVEALTGIGEQAFEQGAAEAVGGAIGKAAAPTLEKTIQKLYFAGNLGPAKDLEEVMPEILLEEKRTPAKTVGGFLGTIGEAKKKIANEVDTAMLHKVPVANGKTMNLGAVEANPTPIADRISQLATLHPSDVDANPGRISAIKNRVANLYSKPRTYAWLNDRRSVLNRELNRFYSMKTPADQAQYLFQHPDFEIDKAEADAIRDTIYPAMDKAAGKPAGYFEQLQRKRGALMSIEDQTLEHAKGLEMRMKQARGAPLRHPGHLYASERGRVGLYSRLTNLRAPDVSKQADKQIARAFGRTKGTPLAKAVASPVGREVLVLPLRMLLNPAEPHPQQ